MHWKIARDPFMALVCAKHGEQAAFEAGFFLDADPEDAALDDSDWLCTPRPKLAVHGERPVVLLATGGFCPVHAGHLAMMESAKLAAEKAGETVIGGYLSPGHDAYLQLKCGAAAIPTHVRLRQCAEAVAASAWLCVDPWEAMYRRVAVNYTDVVARLSTYLTARVDPRIAVRFVCGADNARFALAFSESGGCIVVGRPNDHAEFDKWQARLSGSSRILWVQGDNRTASRHLRAGPWPARAAARLVARCEDARAVRTLGLASFAAFQQQLLEILGRYATVRSVIMRDDGAQPNVISMDAMLAQAHTLAISRCYALGGYESRGHVARPGTPSIAAQLAAIPNGSYVLRDDDCVTGSSFAAARHALGDRVQITDTAVAVTHDADEDVVDTRDFLLGADHGGLVIELPNGTLGRAPYLLPYVDPAVRASISASHAFSLEVWELNRRFFSATDLRVRDLPEPARASLDFDDDARLSDICAWHARRLRAVYQAPEHPAPL